MDECQIVLVARASDAAIVRGQTIRTIVTNTETIAKRKDVLLRFMEAYRETIDYMYSANPQVLKDYAEFNKMPEAMAKPVRDDFFPKALIAPDEIKGLDSLLAEAVTLKFITEPLKPEQIKELIQVPFKK